MAEPEAICIFRGFAPDRVTAAVTAAGKALEDAGYPSVTIDPIFLDDDLLDIIVGFLIEDRLRSNPELSSRPVGRDSSARRYVLILTADHQRLFKIVRGIKSIMEDPQEIIFASVTETALGWSFRTYFSHLSAEHERMKTSPPAEDPDMKPEIEL